MTFEADNPNSPLFWALLIAVLVNVLYAWSGLVRAELPNMRVSVRGARIGGMLALASLACIAVSYYFFTKYLEAFATVALAAAFGLFFAGIFLAERIPD